MDKILFPASVIAILVVVALAAAGWVMNIATLCHMELSPLTGEVIVRIIGIFVAPIGMVAGWV